MPQGLTAADNVVPANHIVYFTGHESKGLSLTYQTTLKVLVPHTQSGHLNAIHTHRTVTLATILLSQHCTTEVTGGTIVPQLKRLSAWTINASKAYSALTAHARWFLEVSTFG